MKNFLFSILLFLVFVMPTPKLWAQSGAGPTTESPLEIQNAVGNVLVAGLVGGVLGLSTLSFYPNPEDNIRNIYFGAGAGAILMTIYMTLTVATTPIPTNLNSPTGSIDPWISPQNHMGFAYNLKF
jgi:hypothetical protein